MSNINEMQEAINQLYIEAFKEYKGGLDLSVPHIPKVSEMYLENRTIVLGQETNTWYRKGKKDGLKDIFLANLNDVTKVCLTDRHDDFINTHLKGYPGKFWEFSRMLYHQKVLEGSMISDNNLSHCWLNLFTVEACEHKYDKNGRPTCNWELAKKVMELQGDLLHRVIQVLEPKRIISVTGHSLDHFLLKKVICATNYSIKPVDKDKILDRDKLAQVIVEDPTHPLHGTTIFRCYHPTYFMAFINPNKKISENLRKRNINSSNSKYYTDTLFSALKNLSKGVLEPELA